MTIGAVQGVGTRSPLEGRTVSVEGIVTASRAASGGKGSGVFVQSARGEEDGDAATSDAVLVMAEGATGALPAPGQRVRVTGTVIEWTTAGDGESASLTALSGARMVAARMVGAGEQALPPRRALVPPLTSDVLERFEGMRVHFEALTLGSAHDSRRDEQIAGFGGRLFQPTELAPAGSPQMHAIARQNEFRTVMLKGRGAHLESIGAQLGPVGAQQMTRAGGTIAGATGVLEPTAGAPALWFTGYRIEYPAPRPGHAPFAHAFRYLEAARALGPHGHSGLVSVAAINVENYFNGDGRGGGFPTARGARDAQDQTRQRAKLVEVITRLRPDIAALMEIENDGHGPGSALAELVTALRATEGAGDWRFVDAGAATGSDAIRVAIIYNGSAVEAVGSPATLEEGPFATHSRAPLAAAFRPRHGAGETLVVVANHFKSKGCGSASGVESDQGDGQSCWNPTRVDSARRLHRWLQGDPTGTGSALTAIVGDFNAYRMEDPVLALTDSGWRDAFDVARRERPYDWAGDGKGSWTVDPQTAATERPYNYVWRGQAGRLDHALLSPALAARLTGAAEWHINADESESLGYDNAGANAVPTPWRSSDHDPLLIGVSLHPRPLQAP